MSYLENFHFYVFQIRHGIFLYNTVKYKVSTISLLMSSTGSNAYNRRSINYNLLIVDV